MASIPTSFDHLRAESTALVAESTLTFRDVRRQAGAIGRAFAEAGLEAGDLVAVATAHRTSFFSCFAGCFACGFPVAILDPSAASQELAAMLRKADPAALIADASILRCLSEQTDVVLPDIVWAIGAEGTTRKSAKWLPAWMNRKLSSSRWPALADVLADEAEPEFDSVDAELPAYVMFTSGTTSKPKAVVISRAALSHHVGTLADVFGYREGARLLCFLPTHHTDGLVHGVAASLLTGMTVVQPGPFTQTVDLEQLLRANSISHFLTVPTMLAMIKRTFGDVPDLFQYGGFKSLISTAGYLDEQLWEAIQDQFSIRISNFYGMTETVSGTLYCGPDDSTYRFGTLGKPVDAEVRIVSDSGNVVPENTIGELQISGKHLMTGYLDDPEATDGAIKDGWLSTGDLFTRDEDGVFRFKGRLKNIIKRGGITVYPEDIRNVISAMPGVLDVEVVGVPDAVFEEIIAVGATVEAGVDRDQVRAFCRDKLSPERRPDRVALMDSLPRGPSGKVIREELIALLGGRKDESHGSRTSLRDQVIKVAAEVFAVDPSRLDESSSPENVDDWDSYAGMQFVLALEEKFALRLGARAIMRMRNIGNAIEIVSAEVTANEEGR